MTTTDKFGAEAAVRATIDALDKDTVLTASRRLTKSALPKRIHQLGRRPQGPDDRRPRRGEEADRGRQDPAETITRFSRKQLIQTVLLVALVYVAYPFISTVPTFFNEVGFRELVVGAARADGVGVDVCRCCSGLVGQRRRRGEIPQSGHHAVRQHLRRDHHPAGVGGRP